MPSSAVDAMQNAEQAVLKTVASQQSTLKQSTLKQSALQQTSLQQTSLRQTALQRAALPVTRAIKDLTTGDVHMSSAPFIVAIDGRCASGKSTLAAYLQQTLGENCTVLHMDHFFLQPAQRTVERLCEPGGNVDYERFKQEVLRPLRQGKGCTYRPYDCQQQTMGEPITLPTSSLCIVEGAYACHPTLFDYYDLRIFLTVGADEQMRRITTRNGEAQAAMFRERWIPLEERYFAAFDIKKRCSMCIDTEQR